MWLPENFVRMIPILTSKQMLCFTNVDRVLPVLQHLRYNENIDVGSVFPLLVLWGK